MYVLLYLSHKKGLTGASGDASNEHQNKFITETKNELYHDKMNNLYISKASVLNDLPVPIQKKFPSRRI